MNGVLIVDKPRDFTSFDLCAKLRGVLRERKIGHAGTLDPMATGVMVIMLGKATRACELLPESGKAYTAAFRFGERTDTLDITGTVVETSDIRPTKQQLLDCLELFRGEIEQLPPMYSAVHVDGKRLYDLARAGKEVDRSSRKIFIERLELLSYDEKRGEGVLDVSCSKGTYIRALVDDIGTALGCGAVLTELRRTRACGFDISQALTLAQLVELGEAAEQLLLPVSELFSGYHAVTVSPAQSARYANGGELDLVRLRLGFVPTDGEYIAVSGADGFIGIGKMDLATGCLRPYKRFI